MDQIEERLLEEVADLHGVPEGAYNIRANGQMAGRNTTANIDITTKTDKPGIDIRIKAGTKHESVHIPVVLSASGLKEVVYNDFYIGDDADGSRRTSLSAYSLTRILSWQAAASTTAESRIRSMTASTASL